MGGVRSHASTGPAPAARAGSSIALKPQRKPLAQTGLNACIKV